MLPVLEVLAAVTGVLAVGALVSGSMVLVRETRIAVQSLQDRAAGIRARAAAHGPPLAALEPPNSCERDLPRK